MHSEITSISVLNASAMQADVWATALFVMGIERAMEAANTAKMPVYMLLRSEQNDGANDPLANSYWQDYFAP